MSDKWGREYSKWQGLRATPSHSGGYLDKIVWGRGGQTIDKHPSVGGDVQVKQWSAPVHKFNDVVLSQVKYAGYSSCFSSWVWFKCVIVKHRLKYVLKWSFCAEKEREQWKNDLLVSEEDLSRGSKWPFFFANFNDEKQ